jgi:hypothetical protein
MSLIFLKNKLTLIITQCNNLQVPKYLNWKLRNRTYNGILLSQKEKFTPDFQNFPTRKERLKLNY